MFRNLKRHRISRLAVASLSSMALLAMTVVEVLAGWGRGG